MDVNTKSTTLEGINKVPPSPKCERVWKQHWFVSRLNFLLLFLNLDAILICLSELEEQRCNIVLSWESWKMTVIILSALWSNTYMLIHQPQATSKKIGKCFCKTYCENVEGFYCWYFCTSKKLHKRGKLDLWVRWWFSL